MADWRSAVKRPADAIAAGPGLRGGGGSAFGVASRLLAACNGEFGPAPGEAGAAPSRGPSCGALLSSMMRLGALRDAGSRRRAKLFKTRFRGLRAARQQA